VGETIGLFIDAHVRHKPDASPALESLLLGANPTIALLARK